MQVNYDKYTDVLYVSFTDEPVEADDTHHTEIDICVRTKNGKIIGLTFVDATFILETTKEKLESSFANKVENSKPACFGAFDKGCPNIKYGCVIMTDCKSQTIANQETSKEQTK